MKSYEARQAAGMYRYVQIPDDVILGGAESPRVLVLSSFGSNGKLKQVATVASAVVLMPLVSCSVQQDHVRDPRT